MHAPNSLVLVGDPAGRPPLSMGKELVAATPSCVAVGTLSEADGATRLRLVETAGDVPPILAFQGTLQTPNRVLAIWNVLGETYLEKPASKTTKVQIWVSHSSEPDEICVLAARGVAEKKKKGRDWGLGLQGRGSGDHDIGGGVKDR